MVSSNVTARTVEANEFPELAQQFGVQGVPRTVVNRAGAFVGALPEAQFVDATLQIAGVPDGGAADGGPGGEEGPAEG